MRTVRETGCKGEIYYLRARRCLSVIITIRCIQGDLRLAVNPHYGLSFPATQLPQTHNTPFIVERPYRKIAELGNEAAFLRSVLQRFVQSRTRAQREQKEREELLARRYEVGWCWKGWKGHLFIFNN